MAELYRKLKNEFPIEFRNVKTRFATIGIFIIIAIVFLPLWNLDFLLTPLLMAASISVAGNFLYILLVLGGMPYKYSVRVPIFFDMLAITVSVHFLGGVTTNFSWVFATALIAIAFLDRISVGIYAAVLCSFMNSGLMIMEWAGIIEPVDLGILNKDIIQNSNLHLFVRLLSDNILFFATALVTGFLSDRLISSNQELESKVAERNEEIARRERIEEELEASERHYRLLADNVTDIIWTQDIETQRFTYFSPSVKAGLGYTVEEALELSVDEVLTPASLQKAMELLAEELGKEGMDPRSRPRARILELQQRHKDGSIIWAEMKMSFLRDKGGRPVSILGVTRDITARKRAEESLRHSEERLKILFEYAPDGYYLCDVEGRFVDGNKAAEDLVGYKKEELIGKSFLELNLLSADQLPVAAENLAESIQRKATGPVELVLNRKDGAQVTVEVRTYPVTIGDQLLVLGNARDITERKRLQQQLFQAQKMESIGTLAGGIAHDFNNLLSGILGYASLAKTRTTRTHPTYNYIDTIERSAIRASELTAQLLAFARGGKYETKSRSLNNIVKEALKIIGRTLDKSIEIEVHSYEPLPMIEADAGQLEQVVINLCINARDAMPDGGKLVIETDVVDITEDYVQMHMGSKPGLYVLLSLTDNGVGMDKATLQKVFEPFFTTKEQGKGTGLGLSMVYGVVKNHGGHVCAYSEPGEGATFKVYLPVNGKPEEEEETKTETETLLTGNELILVVDDEESVRSLAKDILESHGYTVMLAEHGEEAIEIYKARGGDIAIVILDMIMPTMGGRETFLELKELDPKVKALLSTGYSPNGKARDILESGVMGFIQKPYHVNALLSRVRSVLDV